MNNSNTLMHYGVKGMKWGVRRASKSSVKTSSTKKKPTKEQAVENAKKRARKEKVAKYVGKGAEVCAKMATASVVDDVFYGGMGKKIAKETVKQTGRAVVTAYKMANGGYDIRWYDN